MSRYRRKQAEAREFALDWQAEFAENSYSWEEVAEFGDFFTRLGRRWGLLREFRENGIC